QRRHHHVERAAARRLQRLVRVGGVHHLLPARGEVGLQALPLRRVGSDQEDGGGHQGSSASKTNVAGPRIRTSERSGATRTWSGPPGRCAVIHSPAGRRFSMTPAAAVAHAPVPHAWVKPTPRSQTTIFSSRGPRSSTNSTLVRSGKSGWTSSFGPRS